MVQGRLTDGTDGKRVTALRIDHDRLKRRDTFQEAKAQHDLNLNDMSTIHNFYHGYRGDKPPFCVVGPQCDSKRYFLSGSNVCPLPNNLKLAAGKKDYKEKLQGRIDRAVEKADPSWPPSLEKEGAPRQ